VLPYGCLVDFLPTPPVRREQPKMAPNALPGVFLGYWQNPGGRWNGEYLVAEIEEARQFIAEGCDLAASPRLHRVKEVVSGCKAGVIFPLRNWYENRTRIAREHNVRGEVQEDVGLEVGSVADTQVARPPPPPPSSPPPAPAPAPSLSPTVPPGPSVGSLREPGGEDIDGKVRKFSRPTTRPEGIDPQWWWSLTPAQRRKCVASWESKRLASSVPPEGGAEDSLPPPAGGALGGGGPNSLQEGLRRRAAGTPGVPFTLRCLVRRFRSLVFLLRRLMRILLQLSSATHALRAQMSSTSRLGIELAVATAFESRVNGSRLLHVSHAL
jgi:hypothetical protein